MSATAADATAIARAAAVRVALRHRYPALVRTRPFERTWQTWMAELFPDLEHFAPHHEDFWAWVWQIEAGIRPAPFCGIWPRGGAKALALDTPIPTPDGWTTMGAIAVADTVFGHDGMPTRVTEVHPVETRPAYRVRFNDGTSIVASDDHLWTVLDISARRQMHKYDGGIVADWPAWKGIGRPPRRRCPMHGCSGWASGGRGSFPQAQARTLTTGELLDRGLFKGQEKQFAIPTTKPLFLPDVDLPIDPYLFGYWLGDGTSSSGDITVGSDDRDAVYALLSGRGYEIRIHQRQTAFGLYVQRLMPDLRLLGVLNNKHIPDMYLRSGIEQRLAVLQGLLDSDGTVHHSAASSLTVTNRSLAYGAAELARSLGLRPTVTTGRAKIYGRDCGPLFKVHIPSGGLALHQIPRKRDAASDIAQKAMKLSSRLRYVTAIERVPDQPLRCIVVDNPRHLYLAGEAMVPTHNSSSAEMAAVALGALGRRRYGLYVCGTQEQAEKHLDSIAALLESPRIERHYPGMANRAVNKYGSSRGWRRSRFTTASGFVMDAVGLRTGTRGIKFEDQRPDFVIVDDVDELTDTPELTEKKIHMLTHTLLPAGSTDLATLAIQNLIISDGLFARLAPTSERPASFLRDRIVSGPIPAVEGLTTREHDGGRVEVTGGVATWDGQSLATVQAQINDWGYESFLAEAQHQVRARGDKHFLLSWWDGRARYDPTDRAILAKVQQRFQVWDTAEEASETAAYTACVTFDLIPYAGGWAALVRDVWRDKVSADDGLLRVIEQHAAKWNHDGKLSRVVIEYASSGKFAVKMLRSGAAPWLRPLIQRWPVAGVSKDQRNIAAAIPCRAGRVWLPVPHESVPWLAMFTEELERVPQSTYRDMTDAFSEGILFLKNYLRQPNEQDNREAA